MLLLLLFILQTATIPSQSFANDADNDAPAVSSLKSRPVGAAVREISGHEALDDDRSDAGVQRHGNLSTHYDWMSADEPRKTTTDDDADWLFQRRIHSGHRRSRRRGTSASRRRRKGRHVKKKHSFNSYRDYELQHDDELSIATSCGELQCSAAARCVIDERTGHARCRCPLGTAGIYCERGQFFQHRKYHPSLPTKNITNHTLSYIKLECWQLTCQLLL